MNRYNNFSLGDLFVSDKKHEEEMAKLTALNTIANKSTTSSALTYIIPLAILLIGGVIIAVAMKKKKS